MFERPLRLMAIVASIVVAASFVLFATDELSTASGESRAGVQSAATYTPDERPAAGAEQPSPVRSAVDDASDFLLAPFQGFVESSNGWADRGVPALLGLLLYGFGLGYLSRYARGHG